MIYLELFLGFLKVGLFSFGGAYGAIPLIRDTVLSHGWLTDESLSYMIAVSESTPGPIMVNMATFIGNTEAGFPGALTATAAVILPSFTVIILIALALKKYLKNRYVQGALSGLKPCIIGIILATGIYMLFSNMKEAAFESDMRAFLILLILLVFLLIYEKVLKKKASPIAIILVSALLGAGIYM